MPEPAAATADTISRSKPPAQRTAHSALPLPIDIEDEISWVVHEFRKKTVPNKIGTTSHNKRKRTVRNECFSEVRYNKAGGRCSSGPHVEASYLFGGVLSLRFEVSVRVAGIGSGNDDTANENGNEDRDQANSYATRVAFAEDNNDDAGASVLPRKELGERLIAICDALNRKNRSPEKASLFAVLSKLLLSLNQLREELPVNDPAGSNNNNGGGGGAPDATTKATNVLPRLPAWTDRQRSAHLDRVGKRRCRGTGTGSTKSSSGVDLAVLLLRCATAGKHRETFCRPFVTSNKSGNGGSIAEDVWSATEHHQRVDRYRRRRRASTQQQRQQQQQSTNHESTGSMVLPSREQEFLGFLYSLPWMKQGRITRKKTAGLQNENEGRTVLELCLHLDGKDDDNDSDGDASHSPQFARSCSNHGSLTVYHGTRMENAWSILNNGFWNPDTVGKNNEFVRNGAILGSGIYLTTAYGVARYFATSEAPARAVRNALSHDALQNLLEASGGGTSGLLETPVKNSKNNDKTRAGAARILDNYDVSCFSVFEARIVQPPAKDGESNEASLNDPSVASKKTSTNQNNTTNGSSFSVARHTRRDGKYFVVPDGRDIRITKLHLTFELTKKRTSVGVQSLVLGSWWRPLSIALALLVLFVSMGMSRRNTYADDYY